MIAWLFSWPPTPLEFALTVVFALLAGLVWGHSIAARRFNKGLDASIDEMKAHNARVEKIMRDPLSPH